MKHLLFLTALVVFSAGCVSDNREYSKACFPDGSCVALEVVSKPEDLSRGLMYRKSLDTDTGMLFVFERPSVQGFWMKNILIPLDIIWLDENCTMLYISENTQPCTTPQCPSYGTDASAKYVLEVNANQTKERGGKVGDRIKLR